MVLTVLFCIMGECRPLLHVNIWASIMLGFAYHPLTKTKNAANGFVTLYCLANFFQNFGPNVTTFVVPGEVFPTRYRSTAHGISAASGKLGAVIAQVGFARLQNIGGPNAFLPHMSVFSFKSRPVLLEMDN
jgi:MFS transporter, PHS family, inorganic phosphate transporter